LIEQLFGKDDLVQVGQTIIIETEAIVAKRNTSKSVPQESAAELKTKLYKNQQIIAF
jgi:hypothetical protein